MPSPAPHATASHNDTPMPCPKVNIPPSQFFVVEAPITPAIHLIPSHEGDTTSTIHTTPPVTWNAPRDMRFTVAVIILVVCINVCIAWLLGSQQTTPQHQETHPATDEQLSHNTSRTLYPSNSLYLEQQRRKQLLKNIISNADTTYE